MTTETSSRPKVTMLGLGGTIAAGNSGAGGVTPNRPAEEVIREIPGLAAIADVEAQSLRTVPSAEITLDDLRTVVTSGLRAVENGAFGVVLTVGTNLLEEVAFALDLLWTSDAPLIVTGAMRNPTLAGADGAANVLGAAIAASSSTALGLGVLIVFNNEIHAARFVRKTHTTKPSTFASPLAGPIGWISEDHCRIPFRLSTRYSVEVPMAAPMADVGIVQAVLGVGIRPVEHFEATPCAGLVVEATGPGHVSSDWAGLLKRLSKKIPVVLASRTGSGELLSHTYDFEGSEMDLLGGGLVSAGWLDGRKARILLMLSRTAGATQADVERIFATIGRLESSFAFPEVSER